MKRWKILWAVVISMIIPLAANGDEANDRINLLMDRLHQHLRLTGEQLGAIRDILTDCFRQYPVKGEGRPPDDRNVSYGNAAWRDSLNRKIVAVLDTLQRAKYEKVKIRDSRSGLVNQLVENHSLAEEKQLKIERIIEQADNDRRLLRDEAERGVRDRGSIREATQKIDAEMDKMIEPLFTSEQRQAYQEMRQKQRERRGQFRGGPPPEGRRR